MGLRDHIPRSAKARIGDAGRASEKRQAKSLGARLRPASGAMAGAKGDMQLGDFLIEAKSTEKDSIGLKYSVVSKITREALMENREPALTVTFTDKHGRPVRYGQWVLVPLSVFQELTGQ